MDDSVLNTEGMVTGDPASGLYMEQGAQVLRPEPPKVKSAQDYEALPHGSAYLDPEGKQRFKPIRDKNDYIALEEGAEYADPTGTIRTKPKYEGIDFSPQALYDIAHSDKGRKKALEKYYPGKVKEDPNGGFYIEDEDGKLRKPGRGLSKFTAGAASEAIPVVLSGGGALLGGAVGTAASPGIGTVAGGMGGGAYGGYMGSRINDIFSQLAGVYDEEGATRDAVVSAIAGGAGDLAGRGVAAAAPAAKEMLGFASRGAAKTTAKFLGANPEKLETALPIAEKGEHEGSGITGMLGIRAPGTAVSPSAIFEKAPHITNVSEVLEQAFDKSNTFQANAEKFMDKRARDIMANKDIGAIVEDSFINPKAAVSTEEVGSLLKESAQQRAVAQSVEADRQLAEALANRRAAIEAKHAPDIEAHRTRNESVIRTAEQAKSAAGNLVNEGFQAIEKQANDAVRVAQVGHNAGDLWRSVAESFVGLRRSIGERASKMYTDAETASGGLVPPGSNGLSHPAQQLIAELPENFESLHPSIVKKLRDIAGVQDPKTGEWIKEPADATWVQLHNLRSQIRQDIKWNDLPSDIRNGTLKFLDGKINEVLHPADTGKLTGVGGGLEKISESSEEGYSQRGVTYLSKGESGRPDVVASFIIDGSVADLEHISVAGSADLGADRNRVGPSAIRSMLRQFRELHPEVKSIHADRISGARAGGQYDIMQGKEITIDLPEARKYGIQAASKLLKLADAFYRENMGPLNDRTIKSLVKALDSGLQADPKALLKATIREGKTEVAETIKKTVGPQTWDAMRAADVQDMLQSSRMTDGSIDAMKFAKQVEDRFQNGVLGVLHGPAGEARLRQQANYIQQLRGTMPITPRPGDTANDIILRARAAAADADNLSKTDPLKLMSNEMRKVEAAVKKEFTTKAAEMQSTDLTGKSNQVLALLNNSTIGANKAADRILGDPDLIVAASRAFPGGENSSEFQLLRQVWTERFLRQGMDVAEGLAVTSKEVQELMWPGVSLEDMHMLAKEMKLLTSGDTVSARTGGRSGGDMSAGMMTRAAVEHPQGQAKALGELAGPMKWALSAPVLRAMLSTYFTGVRKLATSPSTLRWLRKGLTSRDPEAKAVARGELRAALQRGGARGAGIGQGINQWAGGENQQ
jgi:hypothetical protein